MQAIFISDAHLKTSDTQGYKNLMAFLDSLRGREDDQVEGRAGGVRSDNGQANGAGIDDLYILGDFFDFWFCERGIVYPEFHAIIEKLTELKDRGIGIHICEGNHDFFLEDYFATELGFEVIKDWATIDLEGRRVLISHGDTVDEGNIRYLLLRQLLRSSFFYKLQRALPVAFRWKAAQISSRISKAVTVESTDILAEKMRRFSLRKFREGFEAVILGHCHKHLLEEPVINGAKKTFVILGDWVRHASYLSYKDGAFALSSFRSSGRLSK